MDKERVQYFSSNDFLFGLNLNKIETMSIPLFDTIDINDAIEFYEIKRYFDERVYLRTWSTEDFEKYKNKSQSLYSLTMRFFNQIEDCNIVQYYNMIDLEYYDDFWVLFNNCKLYNKISEDKFEELMHGSSFAPFAVFCHQKIVQKYGSSIRKYIINDESAISIILHVYEQDYTNEERLYLPKELTGDDICNCIDSYIDSKHPNLNKLALITHMQHTTLFPISDKVRLKAKHRYTEESKNFAENSVQILHGLKVSFSETQIEVKKAEKMEKEFSFSYSIPWLMDTLDYPSILNNFLYVFEFADILQMRCSFVSKESQMGIIERILKSNSSRYYSYGTDFELKNTIGLMQVNAYYEFLKKQGIRLENVLKWFFTEYLQTEFSCPEIRVAFPSEETTYAEKCSSIITAFETVLKQFSAYVGNGEIDFELIGMSTTSQKFCDIPSFVKEKYIYGYGEDFNQLTHLLFSDQCTFTYVPRIYKSKKNYSCFYDLIHNEKVYLSDYRESKQPALNYLAKFDLINIADNGLLSEKNQIKLAILRDLFTNEVISKWHYPSSTYDIIQEMINEKILYTKSSLLSAPEVNYFNYLLNHSEYSNGLEIRNKYIHGVQQVNINENDHRQNYLWLLIVFITLVIKINDDFCLKDSITKFYRIDS